MAKGNEDNVLDILEQLYGCLDNSEYYNYDDAEDMELAKKEVLNLLDKMIKRRMKND